MKRAVAGFVLAWSVLAACDRGAGVRGGGGASAVLATVLDAQSGDPVAGAVIEGPKDVRGESDASGRARLEWPSPGASGELRAATKDGRHGAITLRPLGSGELPVVIHVR